MSEALYMELVDVVFDRVAGRSSQFTDFLFAGALRVEAKNLADPDHKDYFTKAMAGAGFTSNISILYQENNLLV
jgi:hypothetical protein